MATNRWRGDSQPVAQVTTLTVGGTPAAGQVYSAVINRKEVSYTAAADDTNATIARGLYTLLIGSGLPAEFADVSPTYAGAGTAVVATAANPGVPFTLGNTAGGTGTLVAATLVASRGPGHVDDPDNWSAGSLPADGDDVVIDGGESLRYGLAALAAVAPGTLTIAAAFSGEVGLPARTAAGYVEYRDRYLQVGGDPTVTVGGGVGTGSGRLLLNVGTGNATVNVISTGPRAEPVMPALILTGAGTGNVLHHDSGDVGLAVEPGTAAGFDTVTISEGSTAGAAQQLTIGEGAVVDAVTQGGGSVDAYADVPSLTQTGGTHTQWAGVLGAVVSDGGIVVHRSTGTTAAVTLRGQPNRPAPYLDCSQDSRPRTFTAATFTGGAALLDPAKSVVFTNPAAFDRESLKASDLGARFNLQRS